MLKRGRPRKEIDKRLFENLCKHFCTEEEISNILECDVVTLRNWCKREYGKDFSHVFEEKKAYGKLSLRHLQFELAKKSPAMAIFLGKNYLDQRDERNVEVKGNLGMTTLAELMMEEYNGQNSDAQSS